VAPDIVKPTPVNATPLIVTGAVPVDVKVRYCVADVFTTTLPNGTLVALILRVGVATFNWSTKPVEMLPAFALSVAVCVDPTGDTAAVNPALVAFAGTVTVAGTETATLLLDRLTLSPLLGAGALNVTVQASVPDPANDALLQDKALSAAGSGSAVPLSPITAVGAVEELLVMVS
jgi:hypothetical protein